MRCDWSATRPWRKRSGVCCITPATASGSTSSETEEDQQRVENLDELLTDAREFDEAHVEDGGLEAFLEQASLVADVDDWNAETDRVTMMTLHAAKGLEFPVVFIIAVEDDMLPHVRSKEHPHQLGGGTPAALRRHDAGQGRTAPERRAAAHVARQPQAGGHEPIPAGTAPR